MTAERASAPLTAGISDVVIVFTTVPVGDLGEALARTLVKERLAACVNLCAPMTSVFRWAGRLNSDEERQLVIKTTADRVAALRDRVAQLHTYELPEFLVCPVIGGSAGYLAWVRAETAPATDP